MAPWSGAGAFPQRQQPLVAAVAGTLPAAVARRGRWRAGAPGHGADVRTDETTT